MPIGLSAKGFAEFVIAGPSKKAQIVRNILKPKTTGAQVVVLYYSKAIKIIRVYHARNNDKNYLAKEVQELEAKLENALTPQSRSGIRNNLRALRGYMDIYGNRKRKIVARPRIYYSFGPVRLSASPDLAVEEGGKLKLIKLGVTKQGDNPEVIRILLRVMYQAAVTRTLQQHASVLNFVAQIDATEKESCLLFEPLIELLEADPGLSNEAKRPEEWARLLRRHLGERWDDSKKLGYGAITRCFRVHADLLATRILVQRVPDPTTQGRGNLYRLQLKGDVLEKLIRAA